MTVRIRVLGTIAIEHGDQSVAITSLRERKVLAVLTSECDHVVSTDHLIDVLWPAGPPPTATTAVQVVISRLRSLLEPGRERRAESRHLITESRGYRLRSYGVDVDLIQLEEALRRGDRSLVERLWNEPLFAEFADEPWAVATARTLVSRWHRVLYADTNTAIANGDVGEIVVSLRAELERRPLEEGIAGMLMLALNAAGEQVSALRVYAALRTSLRDQVGLDPVARLQQLERAIIERAPHLPQVPLVASEPEPPIGVVGCEDELRRLRAEIFADGLVTLVGPAGVGKTTLAAALAAGEQRRRVLFVDMSQATSSADVVSTLADALDVAGGPGTRVEAAIGFALGEVPTLLVLDNCETAGDALGEMLGAYVRLAGLSIVATSRRAINIGAERVVVVPPLMPPPRSCALDEMASNPAVRLLTQHVRGRDIVATEADADIVASIVELTDGLPLALELAAHQLRAISPVELLARLRSDLDLPGPRDAHARHRSLDAALHRSVHDLDRAARLTLDALGAFAGPARVGVVRQLVTAYVEGRGDSPPTPGLDHDEVTAALLDLRARHLVNRVDARAPTPPANDRGDDRPDMTSAYQLLHTVRAFVRRSADQGGTATRWRRAHAQVVARAAHNTRVLRRPLPASELTIDDVTTELTSALDELEASADRPHLHLRLTTDAGSFWYRSGRVDEARRRLATVLDMYPDVEPAQRALTLSAAGLMSFSTGEFVELERRVGEAIDILGSLGVPVPVVLRAAHAVARSRLADVDGLLSSTEEQEPSLARIIEHDIAAFAAWYRGDCARAIARFTAQLVASRAIGDLYFEGRALRGLALMHSLAGDHELAAMRCGEAVRLIDDWGRDRSTTQVLATRAAIAFAVDDRSNALADAHAAIRRAARSFDYVPMMIAVPIAAGVCIDHERADDAARLTGWLRATHATAAQGVHQNSGNALADNTPGDDTPPTLGCAPEWERVAGAAENAAHAALGEPRYTRLRVEGAHDGLAGLVSSLRAR